MNSMSATETSAIVQAICSVVGSLGVCLVFWQVRKAKEVAVMQNTLAFIDSATKESLQERLTKALAP